MAEDDRVKALEADLEAAHRVIDTLIQRIERQLQADVPQEVAVVKAFANLESVVERRTRELFLSQARYRALYDHSPDMLLAVDEDGRITAANQTSRDGLGDACKPGNALLDLFTKESKATALEALGSHFDPGDGFDVQLGDGRHMFMVTGALPGFSGSIQVGMRDITARRELVAQLSHARRLASLGHLAAGVAHEINNPLSVMQLGVELLLEDPLRPDMSAQLNTIHQHSLRIARIVQNLQSFGHPRYDEREVFPVEEVIQSAITVAALPPTILVLSEVGPGLNLKADRGRAEQILVNLLNNASAALGGSGQVHIRAEAVAGMVSIAVQDNGPGIDEDLLEHIFTPLSRAACARGLGWASPSCGASSVNTMAPSTPRTAQLAALPSSSRSQWAAPTRSRRVAQRARWPSWRTPGDS